MSPPSRHAGWRGLPAALVLCSAACNEAASTPPPPPPVRVAASTQAVAPHAVRATDVAQPTAATQSAFPVAAGSRSFAGTQLEEVQVIEQLQRSAFTTLRPVGNTSTVFKASLGSDSVAAFKAATRERPRGPQSEIAAYRLARSLGLRNVPPVAARRVPPSLLRERLDADHADQWPDIEARLVIDSDRRVLIAAIYWIDELRTLGLESAQGQKRIAAWLTLGTELPSEQRELAAQVSTMIAFDYLIGNWDRWSGGNIKGDSAGRLLYMRDHDAAFPARLSEPLLRRMLAPLLGAQRFSRGFYLALRALTPDALRAELALDTGVAPEELLDDARIAGLFDRRETLLSHIAAEIEQHGEVDVLVFP